MEDRRTGWVSCRCSSLLVIRIIAAIRIWMSTAPPSKPDDIWIPLALRLCPPTPLTHTSLTNTTPNPLPSLLLQTFCQKNTTTFDNPTGIELSATIAQTMNDLQLYNVVGCAPRITPHRIRFAVGAVPARDFAAQVQSRQLFQSSDGREFQL
mmetsp:Transcript_27856/g.28256  ORF Transcript_27856/g.28256 Transcript_27856/m.28256 type:complete len:152 (+) Transcript_27856:63-518(+)